MRQATKKKNLLVADLFCGAGGSSTGARNALRKLGHEMTLTCVNHWPVAIETHKRNHPDARHYCQDVSALRPLGAVPEGYLDLLMASPSCVYHSRARGGRPTSDQQRMDPWHVITWLTELRVKRLLIENVPEFVEWGPVDMRTGRPLQSRKGEYFQQWVKTIKALGFKVDWRVLNAADYGDATTRMRFFLMARSDGKPIQWPEPTHFRDGGRDLFGERQKWRAAREIIDWQRPGRSIFGRKKPLAPKTLARIMAGAKKFGWPEPFLVILRQHMDAKSIDGPVPAITAGGTHIGVAEQVLTPFVLNRHGADGSTRPRSVDEPAPTVTCSGAGYIVEPSLTPFVIGQHSCSAARDTTEPLMTIATGGAISLTEPVLISVTGGDKPKAPKSADEPLGTITTRNGVGIAEPFVFPVNQGHDRMKGHRGVDNPLPTLLTRESLGVVTPMISPYYGSSSGETCKSVDVPLDSITTKARFGVVEPCLITVAHGDSAGEKDPSARRAHSIEQPVPAITAGGRQVAVVEPVAQPFVISPRHGKEGAGPSPRSAENPLPTITAGGSQMGIVEPALEAIAADATLAEAAAQGRLILIDGKPYLLDIRFRMLEPYELARAMGFSDEEAEYEFVGTKTDVTKQIGNAVPVKTSTALVSALFSTEKPVSISQVPACANW